MEGGELRATWLLCAGVLAALVWSGCGSENVSETSSGSATETATESGAGTSTGGGADTPYVPNWSQTRHGVNVVVAAPQLSVEAGPTATEDPPRALLLCNVDDDDEDGLRDVDNAVIDGDGDANDLARIQVAPLAAGAEGQLSLVLVAPEGGSGEAKDAVRIYDEGGQVRLGRGEGATWILDAGTQQTLASRGLRLFAEGCTFRERVELRLLRDNAPLGRVLLEVAPLLLAPPTTPVDAIWIGTDDHYKTKALLGAFQGACSAVKQGDTDEWLREVPIPQGPPRDFWLQDEMQWGYTETPFAYLPIAIHMPRGILLAAWVRRMLAPDVGYVLPCALPVDGEVPSSYAYGGNLEPGATWGDGCPGCIVHGFNPELADSETYARQTLEALTKFLDGYAKQPAIRLDTSWLYVGHVDEMVSFLWSPSAAKELTLLVASPGEGVWLLEQIASKEVPERVGWKYRRMPTNQDYGSLTWKDFLEARLTENEPSLTHFNLELEKHIFGDPNDPSKPGVIEPLRKALEAATGEGGIEQVKIVPVPTFFYRGASTSAADAPSPAAQVQGAAAPVVLVDAIALLPNMINLVALDGHLIVPDPLLESFQDALAEHADIEGRFTTLWIDVFDFLHSQLGSLHCATNVRHKPPESGKWWEGD